MSGGEYARRRGTIRGPLTGLILVGIVMYGAYWGWQSAFGEDATTTPAVGCPTSTVTSTATGTTGAATTAATGSAGSTTGAPATTTPSGPPVLQPQNVTVNVYNATDRPGLAANTASALRARSFTIGDVANDPLSRTIAGVAEIRAGRADEPAVLLLIQHVPGAVVVADGRTDGTVDLVTGDAFVRLGDPATVTPVPLPSTSKPC
jgi:hypothetical protein